MTSAPLCGSSPENRPADRLGENKDALPDARRRGLPDGPRTVPSRTAFSRYDTYERPFPAFAAELSRPTTGADLGQNAAKNEALSKEQLRHMEGGEAAKSAQEQKARKRPR